MTQLRLFQREDLPPAVPVSTSIEAAEAVAGLAPAMRARVRAYIMDQRDGATRHEIAAGLRMKLQTVCGRCNELLKLGLIYQSDETRKTSGLGSGKVLRATSKQETIP